MASLNVAMMALWSSLKAERRDAWRGWETLGIAGPAAETPVERVLSFVCSPPLWQLLLLLLGLTAGLALHFALLQLLGNLPRRRVGRLGNCRLCRWPLALSAGVLFLLTALRFAPGAALAGAILLSSALLLLAVVDAATLRLPDVVTQPLLWLGLLFNLGTTFVPLPDAVCGAVIGYLMLWGVNGCYRLVCRRHGLGAGDFKLLAALGAWLGWRALPPLLLLAATGGLMCVICVRRWRGADLAPPLAFGPWLALAGALLLFWNGG